ncbi:uncharacterized protein N7518_001987 [Penicillium psychrosexuale]|uniref:uncharacterized protein n=1 Tax=Penicillium psychrosexuale TaxID=1002107 RepID=UPI0025455DE8|nr:uncharacterized protein N7518_001987 [Penicillium psychrosexuale]KAJ5799919.1 hypothetical protein N7518_001987 [Penicillium psychrosexuale]
MPQTLLLTQPRLPNRQQVIAEDDSRYSIANDDTSCLPEESGRHGVEAPSQIPTGEAGSEDTNPGPWADYAMTVILN